MSDCNNCIHRDRDCVIDPPEGDYCRQYHPTILSQIPPSRGTTAGELTRMHVEAEQKAMGEGVADMLAGRVTEMDFSQHVESENPDHYKTGGIECIDALRDALGHDGFIAYCRGQIIRYAWRIGKKDACLVEALKLEKYANWMVDEFNGKELRK